MSLTGVLRLVVLVVAFLRVTTALAGDYTVSCAFDATTEQDVRAGVTSPLNEAGTSRECAYDAHCRIELTKPDLSITVIVTRSKRDTVFISANRGQPSRACCYFSDGRSYVFQEIEPGPLHLGLCEGHARKGNEFVQNLYLGILYLQFSNLR